MEFEDCKRKSISNIVPSRFDILKVFNIYKCLSIKAQLHDCGYNINSSDREMMFIDIITKNDPKEIGILEKYLEAYDVVQEDMDLLKKFDKFFKDLKESENLNKTYTTFIKSFS